jgi:GNAT superfamily N-acetyltransferase
LLLGAWFTQLNPDYADVETLQRLDGLAAAACAVVAEAGDVVVGVAGLGGLWLDEELTEGLERPAEVFSVYVAHAWLGQGVGRAMLDVIEAVAVERGYTDLLAVSGTRHRDIGYPFWNTRYGPPVRVDADYWAEGAERVVWRLGL